MQATAAKVGFTMMLLLERHRNFSKQFREQSIFLRNAHIFQNNVLVQSQMCNYCIVPMVCMYLLETLSTVPYNTIHFVLSTPVSRCGYTSTHIFCENCQELKPACQYTFLPSYSSFSQQTKCCEKNSFFCIQLSCMFGSSLTKQL